jgi:serine/threonine protein kinase
MSRHGTQIGPYTLHEEINAGGMSEIWLGTDTAGKAVAIRLMLNNTTFAFTERKRFITGCETLQACQDGNHIIGYIEHGKIGGELALVLEYVEGENL